jgi:hypothetical protein
VGERKEEGGRTRLTRPEPRSRTQRPPMRSQPELRNCCAPPVMQTVLKGASFFPLQVISILSGVGRCGDDDNAYWYKC